MSIDVPTGNPLINRPRDSRSTIAISSATRTGGLYRATELPSTVIAARDVRVASTEPITFGDGMSP